jgi:uncharacterized protein YdhG (YjbR/CyaY superfamily)
MGRYDFDTPTMKSDMNTDQTTPATIDEYIARFPPDAQEILQQIRKTIRQAAPDAQEKIAYQMPTFYLDGNLVHFAAFKHHIGFYPIPYALITQIVKFRVKENLAKAEANKKKK